MEDVKCAAAGKYYDCQQEQLFYDADTSQVNTLITLTKWPL
mgnify:CR=1 FL=1